ncbi:DEAD/DEAH box helicase [Aquisalimonas sp.]|uniref:DEAD/DEAH box helicase n=1 Tax=Aquisalimonas sp. TaxID=1872621 RepID=UPI0025BCD846|nr:DEAD/DEAH box helicase [Aquisalimonas sp.]
MDLQKIRKTFDQATWQRGEAHFREGRVTGFEHLGEGRARAQVQATRTRAYRVFLEWPAGANQPEGDCDCPAELNCEHAVAALLRWVHAPVSPGPASTRGRAGPSSTAGARVMASPSAHGEGSASPRLLYLVHAMASDPSLMIALHVGTRSKLRSDGGYDRPRPFRMREQHWRLPPRFISDQDLDRLHWLDKVGCPFDGGGSPWLTGAASCYLIPPPAVAATLETLLPSGCCYWEHADQTPLRCGPARPGELHWRLRDDARQRLELRTEPPSDDVLPSAAPWYRDGAVVGPVDADPSAPVARALNTGAWMEPEEAEQAVAALAAATPREDIPPPHRLRTRMCSTPPVPVLRLVCRSALAPELPGHRVDSGSLLVAELAFDYGEEGQRVRIGADAPHTLIDRLVAGERLRVRRDTLGEADYAQRLDGCHRLPAAGELPLTGDDDATAASPEAPRLYSAGRTADEWVAFVFAVVPELVAAGWRVETSADFPYKPVIAEGWDAEVTPDAGDGWFGLGLGVTVDGERIELLPLLVSALRELPAEAHEALRDEERWSRGHVPVPLPDGRLLAMPGTRLQPLLTALIELFDREPALDRRGRLPVSAMDAHRLLELAETGWPWNGPEGLKRLGERLREGLETVPAPASLRAQLRAYQHTGLCWLQLLHSEGFGGVLADDMGLGKTVQTLAHVLAEKEAGRLERPCLVVAPTSLLFTWMREAQRFAPGLQVQLLHGAQRRLDALDTAELVVTSYGVLRSDIATLADKTWHVAILDEAQHIKNPRSNTARAARRLRAQQRLCLTGTPLENHLGELWSLFHFLMPGFLGDDAAFRRRYRRPIEEFGDETRREQLARRVRPFLLRRTKAAVAPELPAKTEIQHLVEMGEAQRDLYEGIRLSVHRELERVMATKGLERSRIELLDALLKLRQVCCDPRLVRADADIAGARTASGRVPSAKLQALCDLLPALIEDGRRVLVFSQFTSMLRLIEARLVRLGLDWVKLTGRTRDRAAVVDRFQAGAVPLMLISLKAGGTGLTLTAADTVIHYDPWWNPAVEAQATDRAHRIGQDKPVFVYRLICKDTVEERIQQLQAHKATLAEGIYHRGASDTQEAVAGLGMFSALDLRALVEGGELPSSGG